MYLTGVISLIEPEQDRESCGYKCGSLPACAPLAIGYVPNQDSAAPRYGSDRGLARGTLFPGLDLPLDKIVNQGTAVTPAAELMALDFAAHDLSLYLDTHADDREAFEVYRDLLRLAEEGKRRYVQRFGPVCKSDLVDADSYTWLNGPWPWERDRQREA